MENMLISACLIGLPCRYDGKSKTPLDKELIESLKQKYNLIPVCPEIYGGLPTPRTGSERVGGKVFMKDGTDVTENYRNGAALTLQLARFFNCKLALLKERSPSCGVNFIHDGTFTNTIIRGEGVTAELLRECGIKVFSEESAEKIL